jgi:hypothetical protein
MTRRVNLRTGGPDEKMSCHQKNFHSKIDKSSA